MAVKPKCGRMVAFSGGMKNIHGVRGIKSGRRCALPLWFTLQGNKIEDDRGTYQNILNELRKQKNELEAMTPSDVNEAMKRTLGLQSKEGSKVKSEL